MLTSRIPCREEVDASGEESSFEDAEENAETEERGPIGDETECLDRMLRDDLLSIGRKRAWNCSQS